MRKALPILMVLSLLVGSAGMAAVAPLKREFRVNTNTADSQWNPAVAMNGANQFLVVWDSYDQDGSGAGVFGQMFDSAGKRVGSELQVNTYTTGFQSSPVVAGSEAGGFVVVWQGNQDGSGAGVFGQVFDNAGGRVGAEFQVNTYTTNAQFGPAVAVSAVGDFVVVWASYHDGSAIGVFGQMFDSAGGRVGLEFQVNSYTTSTQVRAAVSMSTAGDFVVVWQSETQDGSGSGVVGQLFDSGGGSAGAEFQVNTYTTDWQSLPAVAMSGTGDFAAVWTSPGQDAPGFNGVFGQMFDSGGSPIGAEFQVNTYTTNHQAEPSIAMNDAGDFVVTWHSVSQDGDTYGVFGQSFDDAGSPVGVEFQVNTYTTWYQARPSVAIDAAGDFVVAWDSYQDRSSYGIFAQRFIATGPSVTNPIPGGTVDCSDPSLVRPTFDWDMSDYDQFKVYMGSSPTFGSGTRVTSGDKPIVTGSWSPTRKKWKSACSKALAQSVDPNSPAMYIAVEGQDTGLSKGDPRRKVLSLAVRAEVQP